MYACKKTLLEKIATEGFSDLILIDLSTFNFQLCGSSTFVSIAPSQNINERNSNTPEDAYLKPCKKHDPASHAMII